MFVVRCLRLGYVLVCLLMAACVPASPPPATVTMTATPPLPSVTSPPPTLTAAPPSTATPTARPTSTATRAATVTPDLVLGPGNVGQLRELVTWRPEGGVALQHVTWSPDGRSLGVVALHGRAMLWELASQRVAYALTDVTSALVFAPGGRQLVAGVGSNAARLWDAATGREQRTLAPHPSKVQGVAYSPDGVQLFAASTYGPLKLWEVATGRVVTDTGYESSGVALRAAFAPDGRLLAVGTGGSRGQRVELWEVSPIRRVARLPNEMVDDIYGLAWSPDGSRLATGSLFGNVTVWDVARAQRVWRYRLQQASAQAVAWSPDGRTLAVAGGAQGARLLEGATGRELGVLPGSAAAEVEDIAFSPDGRSLAMASRDGALRVWGVGR